MDFKGIFALPFGVSFAKEFAKGLVKRLEALPPSVIPKVEIYLNSLRMRQTVIQEMTKHGARLFPQFLLVNSLTEHPEIAVHLPKARLKYERLLVLSELIKAYATQTGAIASASARFTLAETLDKVLAEFHREAIEPAMLNNIIPDEFAENWKMSAEFLKIANGLMNRELLVDPQSRARFASETLAEKWKNTPPDYPILIAGSTGSRGETQVLMEAVHALPQGGIILPGWDACMSKEVSNEILQNTNAEDHPQTSNLRLITKFNYSLDDIRPWGEPFQKTSCSQILSLALTPAPVTKRWRSDGEMLKNQFKDAFQNLTLIEAETPLQEAESIAVLLKEASSKGLASTLVTPDRTLARRVTQILSRFKLIADDSAGQPLHQTPPGLFLQLVAESLSETADLISMIATLKHPFVVNQKGERGSHLQALRALEKDKLRGTGIEFRPDLFDDWREENPYYAEWFDWIKNEFSQNFPQEASLKFWIEVHLKRAKTLTKGIGTFEESELWQKDAGQKAQEVFDMLSKAAQTHDTILSHNDYKMLFSKAISDVNVTITIPVNSNIAILGTQETRVDLPDLIVLGGLNEGTWPLLPNDDPWINRKMRELVGLPPLSRLTGLSAHDFYQAMGAEHVILSRALKDGGQPTVASRWLLRLTNLSDGLKGEAQEALLAMRARGAYWIEEAKKLTSPLKVTSAKAQRPAPAPPLPHRPQKISVTQVETLIRDPYAIYARNVLKLYPLPPLGEREDMRARGIALHTLLERFVKDGYLLDVSELEKLADEIYPNFAPDKMTAYKWKMRLLRKAEWFLNGETNRRNDADKTEVEQMGMVQLEKNDLRLSAKADRIALLKNGNVAIFDYKSSDPPALKEVKNFSKQLPLTAAILKQGGFQEFESGMKIDKLTYLGFNGNERDIDMDDKEINESFERFSKLFLTYQDPHQPFVARLRPKWIQFKSDYDQLSRYGEWEDGDKYEVEYL